MDEAIQRMKMYHRKTLPDSGAVLFEPGSVELKPLAKGVPAQGVRWHMIGHLQRNKAKKIFDLVRLVHSCDSLRLAEELQTIAVKKDTPVEVLLQVNCSGEDRKYGCPLPAAIPLTEPGMATMLNIRIRGLMTMAPNVANPEDARSAFSRLRDLYEEMRTMNLTDAPFNILSISMSNDYEVAMSEGANVVRVAGHLRRAQGRRGQGLPEEDE